MNTREEAGKIYRSLPVKTTSKPIFIKGGPNRRRNVVSWLKYYGADAVSRLYVGGKWVYEFRKLRSMGAPIKNPGRRHIHSAKWRHLAAAIKRKGGGYFVFEVTPRENPQRVCEYCRLLACKYQFSTSRDEKRRTLARFKLHKKALHTNPPAKSKQRLAIKYAKQLYAHFKTKGVPAFIMRAVPDNYRSIVEHILKINGVAVRA